MKLHRINALLLKYWYITIKRLDRIFDLFYWPMIDIMMWGLVTYFIEDISKVNLISMFIGGFILWIILWRTSVDLATYVLEDYWSKNLYNVFTSPIKVSELVVSLVIFGTFRSFISFVFLGVMASILYSFNIISLGLIPLIAFIPALLLMGWALGIFLVALIFRFGQRIQVFAWSAVWFVQPFSCVTYPLASLPEWAQHIAVWVPSTYIFEGMRSVLATGTFSWTAMGYAFSGAGVLLILASFVLAWATRRAKYLGMFSRME